MMEALSFDFTRERLFPGFDGKTCKVLPSLLYDGDQTMVLMYQSLVLTGCDAVFDFYSAVSHDKGKTFSEPSLMTDAGETVNGIRKVVGPCSSHYNRCRQKWFIFCYTHYFRDQSQPIFENGLSLGTPCYTLYDPGKQDWDTARMRPLPFPFETHCCMPFGQVIEEENGDMLLTFYYSVPGESKYRILTVLYRDTEDGLTIIRYGSPLRDDSYHRGLCEPSLALLKGKYYMAIRSDAIGLYAVSEDGYHFSDPKPWVWDDGSVLENYNTQQRWVRNPKGLFLVYTRRGAHNDHVFRHRAPLFIARFDEDRECLLRDTELALVPELGARLGNFSSIALSDREFCVITAEWMQPLGCEKYGSDNSLWLCRLFFTES